MRAFRISFLLAGVFILWIGVQMYRYFPRASSYWVRFPTLEAVYGDSQYRNKKWKYWIPDETVYSYAAGAYLKGANPILVEPTQPPLGKYLLGLSILLTGNENITVLASYVVFLLSSVGIAWLLTKRLILAIGTGFFLSVEPLIESQIRFMPLLDLFQITFIFMALLCALVAFAKEEPRMIWLTMIFFCAAAMTKVWLVAFVFVFALFITILLTKRRYLPHFFIGGAMGSLVFVASYIRMLSDGFSLFHILSVQKWLLWYQQGKVSQLGTVWPLVYFNQWHAWWGEQSVITDSMWTARWPVFITGGFIISVIILVAFFRGKKKDSSRVLLALSFLGYAFFISFGQASSRYLIPLVPLGYLLSADGFSRLMLHFGPNIPPMTTDSPEAAKPNLKLVERRKKRRPSISKK